jgi:hypothetical protein
MRLCLRREKSCFADGIGSFGIVFFDGNKTISKLDRAMRMATCANMTRANSQTWAGIGGFRTKVDFFDYLQGGCVSRLSQIEAQLNTAIRAEVDFLTIDKPRVFPSGASRVLEGK